MFERVEELGKGRVVGDQGILTGEWLRITLHMLGAVSIEWQPIPVLSPLPLSPSSTQRTPQRGRGTGRLGNAFGAGAVRQRSGSLPGVRDKAARHLAVLSD